MEALSRISRAARPVSVVRPGRVGYAAALELQGEAVRRLSAGGPETLFLLEHDPVFTLGRNATISDVIFTPERCREVGIEVHESDRGGKVTYHGPGQLVGYPVLNLAPDRRDVRRYVRDLEEALIRTLADLGIAAGRSPLQDRLTSVWVGNDKIAAIGIHLSRWITTHGFALNVTNEPLENFLGIVPCGVSDGGVTSIERATGRRFSVAEVGDAFLPRFTEVFDRQAIGNAT